MTFLARSLSFSSIKTYLAAVRYRDIELGFSLDFEKLNLLHLLLRGVKRSKGELVRPQRLPITLPLMKSLKEGLRTAFYNDQDEFRDRSGRGNSRLVDKSLKSLVEQLLSTVYTNPV